MGSYREAYAMEIVDANHKETLVAATKHVVQFSQNTTRVRITLHSATTTMIQIVARDAGAGLAWDNDLTQIYMTTQYETIDLTNIFFGQFDVVFYSAGTPTISYIGFGED